jgi:type IX secretion system PorP/SprF family membrane protein
MSTLSPAFSGFYDDINTSLTYKAFWLGYDGAPEFFRFNYDMPLQYGTGLGISAANYNVGIFNDFNTALSYSYNVEVAQEHFVYLGLTAEYMRTSVNYSRAKSNDLTDPVLRQDYLFNTTNKFNSSFGLAYHWLDLYAGINVYNLFRRSASLGSIKYPVNRQFQFFANYTYPIQEEWKLKGYYTMSKIRTTMWTYDFTVLGQYDDNLYAGLNWRRPTNVGMLVGGFIDDNIYLNYFMNITAQPGFINSMGSHEITLGYRFKKSSWLKSINKKTFNVIDEIKDLIDKLFKGS